jgi:hypothetical protein
VGEFKAAKLWTKEKGLQVGDIVIISGKVPWDDEEHNHSFFVSRLKNGEVDKVSGNPGRPKTTTFEVEAARAPKRQITSVIRMTDAFLGRITGMTDQ